MKKEFANHFLKSFKERNPKSYIKIEFEYDKVDYFLNTLNILEEDWREAHTFEYENFDVNLKQLSKYLSVLSELPPVLNNDTVLDFETDLKGFPFVDRFTWYLKLLTPSQNSSYPTKIELDLESIEIKYYDGKSSGESTVNFNEWKSKGCPELI